MLISNFLSFVCLSVYERICPSVTHKLTNVSFLFSLYHPKLNFFRLCGQFFFNSINVFVHHSLTNSLTCFLFFISSKIKVIELIFCIKNISLFRLSYIFLPVCSLNDGSMIVSCLLVFLSVCPSGSFRICQLLRSCGRFVLVLLKTKSCKHITCAGG